MKTPDQITTAELPIVEDTPPCRPSRPAPKRSCRRHFDCDSVDLYAKERGNRPPFHCNNPDCDRH